MDKSLEKENVTNSSRRAPEGHACSGRLPKPAERCFGDSLTLRLPALSHSGGLHGSEWHSGVSPA